MSIRSLLVISNSEQLFNAIDLLPITFGMILTPNLSGKNSINSQINPGTTYENMISELYAVKILLDNGAGVLIMSRRPTWMS